MASSPVPVMPAQVSAASYGRLQLAVTGRNDYTPIENAVIQVTDTGNPDNIIEELTTDNSGETPTIELPAPPVSYSLESSSAQPYSEYNFTVQAEGYSNLTISGAQILANGYCPSECPTYAADQHRSFSDRCTASYPIR